MVSLGTSFNSLSGAEYQFASKLFRKELIPPVSVVSTTNRKSSCLAVDFFLIIWTAIDLGFAMQSASEASEPHKTALIKVWERNGICQLVLVMLHYYEVRTEKSFFVLFCFQENTSGNVQKVEITEAVRLENYRSCYGTVLLQMCFNSSLLIILKMRELMGFDRTAD